MPLLSGYPLGRSRFGSTWLEIGIASTLNEIRQQLNAWARKKKVTGKSALQLVPNSGLQTEAYLRSGPRVLIVAFSLLHGNVLLIEIPGIISQWAYQSVQLVLLNYVACPTCHAAACEHCGEHVDWNSKCIVECR